MELLFQKRYNVSPEFDVENIINLRAFTLSRCICRRQTKLLNAVCCFKPLCRMWPKR